MTLHGGVLTASSEGVGKGSSFSMELPLYRKESTASPIDEADISFQDVRFNHNCGSLRSSLVQTPSNHSGFLVVNRRSKIGPAPIVQTSDEDIRMSSVNDGDTFQLQEVTANQDVKSGEASKEGRHLADFSGDFSLNSQKVTPEYLQLSDSISRRHSLVPSSPSLRILIADDSLPNRKVMKQLLTKCGHVVREAMDGEDFLTMMGYELLSVIDGAEKYAIHPTAIFDGAQMHFDIILIDDNMPVINGSDAVRLLRKEGYVGKIVGLTGDVDVASRIAFLEKGADDVLCKPIKMVDLSNSISKLLAKRH